MSRSIPLLLVAIALMSCSRKENQAAPVAKPQRPVVAVAATAATQTTNALPAREEIERLYASASMKLDMWGGNNSDLDKAHDELLQILALDRDYAPAYAALARLEYKKGHLYNDVYDEQSLINARKFATHAVKLDPSCVDCQLALAYVHAFNHDVDLAREAVARVRELRPDSTEAGVIEAQISEDEQDIPGAIKQLRAIVKSPKFDTPRSEYEAWADLAHLFRIQSFRSDADEAFRKCISLRPESAWAHGDYAGFLLDGGDVDGAIVEGERAVAIVPYDIAVSMLSQAYAEKATALWSQSRFDDAGTVIQKAVRLSPANADGQYYVGEYFYAVFVRTSDAKYLRQAQDHFRSALKIAPDHQAAKKALDRIEKSAGQR